MYQYNTIESDDLGIKLTAMYEGGKYIMPSIEFENIIDPESVLQNFPLFWDNPNFIFNEFLEFLRKWKNRKIIKRDEEIFKDILPILTEDLVDELIEMLEEALKQGWYENNRN